MLSDEEIGRLRHGTILWANVNDSRTGNPAGPHWVVLIGSDEEIKSGDPYEVVVITHNKTIEPRFLVGVPERAKHRLYIDDDSIVCCGYIETIFELAIEKIGMKLFPAEMEPILKEVIVAKSVKAKERAAKDPPRE